MVTITSRAKRWFLVCSSLCLWSYKLRQHLSLPITSPVSSASPVCLSCLLSWISKLPQPSLDLLPLSSGLLHWPPHRSPCSRLALLQSFHHTTTLVLFLRDTFDQATARSKPFNDLPLPSYVRLSSLPIFQAPLPPLASFPVYHLNHATISPFAFRPSHVLLFSQPVMLFFHNPSDISMWLSKILVIQLKSHLLTGLCWTPKMD